jgi:hypothetical protein
MRAPVGEQKEGYLNGCGCPEDLALLELWMIKKLAGCDSIQDIPRSTEKKDVRFNPYLLTYVQEAILETSGLHVNELFEPEPTRLVTVFRALFRAPEPLNIYKYKYPYEG